MPEANKRMEDNGNNDTISFDSVMRNLGISEDELLDTEDVGLELSGRGHRRIAKIIVLNKK